MSYLLLSSRCARVAALAATVLVSELDLPYYMRELPGANPVSELLDFEFFCSPVFRKDIPNA